MRFIGNIIWFVFGGWYLAIGWILGAIIFAITIIGLPITRAAIEMAATLGLRAASKKLDDIKK